MFACFFLKYSAILDISRSLAGSNGKIQGGEDPRIRRLPTKPASLQQYMPYLSWRILEGALDTFGAS